MDPEVACWILRGSSCRGSTRPRDPARISGISCTVGRFLTAEPPGQGVASNVYCFLGSGYMGIFKYLLNTVLNSTWKLSICIFHN